MNLTIDTAGDARPFSRRSIRWPLIVVGLLGVHVTLMCWAAFVATRDPNAAIIPDYYAKSLKWDVTKEEQRASTALGWKVSLSATGPADAFGNVPATLVLTDAGGSPIGEVNSAAELTLFHEAHAGQRTVHTIRATERGTFLASLPIGRKGFYLFAVRMSVNGKLFTHEWHQFIDTPTKGGSTP